MKLSRADGRRQVHTLANTQLHSDIWPVIDLFSGCGGMSYGFAKREPFRVIAAIDAEEGKPGEGQGKLDCNSTYAANIGIEPMRLDISKVKPKGFLERIAGEVEPPIAPGDLTVLLCCPPCTDFSRAKPTNHRTDSPKNSLVVKCAKWAEVFLPEFVILENARELINGKNDHHYKEFVERLKKLGYDVKGDVYTLTRFGLPQTRQRAIVIASRLGAVKTLDDLWQGWEVDPTAVTVRHAIGALKDRPVTMSAIDPDHPLDSCPGFKSDIVRRRMEAIPRDGGSSFDLANHPNARELLVPSIRARLEKGDFGSHCDVYGRLWWDRPAPTIKRECAHVGNGRYCHPEQTRLLTVREMALLQGFPDTWVFTARSLANRYRHIGDAVPPMISWQLSALVVWMKTGVRPEPRDWILPGTSLKLTDVRPTSMFAVPPSTALRSVASHVSSPVVVLAPHVVSTEDVAPVSKLASNWSSGHDGVTSRNGGQRSPQATASRQDDCIHTKELKT